MGEVSFSCCGNEDVKSTRLDSSNIWTCRDCGWQWKYGENMLEGPWQRPIHKCKKH